jgi:hypothetical protein
MLHILPTIWLLLTNIAYFVVELHSLVSDVGYILILTVLDKYVPLAFHVLL